MWSRVEVAEAVTATPCAGSTCHHDPCCNVVFLLAGAGLPSRHAVCVYIQNVSGVVAADCILLQQLLLALLLCRVC